MSAPQTIGFVGVGKIGLPISQNLIKNGHRVVGYRRSSLEEFEKLGGVPARSAAEVGAQALSEVGGLFVGPEALIPVRSLEADEDAGNDYDQLD